MQIVTFLFLGLVFGQLTSGQEFFDEGSGENPWKDTIFVDSPPQDCPRNKMGKNCAYDLYDLNPEVPWSEFGSDWSGNGSLCGVYGQAGVYTFDGVVYEHKGRCKYTMFQIDDPYMPYFAVDVLRETECSHGKCIKRVEIHHEMCEIVMEDGFTTVHFHGSDMVHVVGPDDEFSREGMFISKHNAMRHVNLFDGELVVSCDGRSDIFITLGNFPFQVSGMCGNRDGNKYDDKEISALDFMDTECIETFALPHTDCIYSEVVHSACMKMAHGTFAKCNRVFNPIPFVAQCMEEMCLCNYMEKDYCLCDVVQQYARVCSDAHIEIDEWRTAPCSVNCRSNMEWTECGRGPVARCSAVGVLNMYFTPCQARCECPNDKIWDVSTQSCTTYDQCPCTHLGRTYKSGETRSEDCTSCLCDGGMWSCTMGTCNATAWSYGHYHYKTFDGAYFTAAEECQVLLAEDTDVNFQVYVQTFQGETYRAEKDVDVYVRMGTHVMHYLLSRDGQLFVHVHGKQGTAGMAPEAMPHFKRGVVDIVRLGERGFDMLLIQFRVRIQFDGIGFLVVMVPQDYFGRMRGIGGNFNGIIKDDENLPSGESANPIDLVRSWRRDYVCENHVHYHPSICWGDDIEHICGHIVDNTLTACSSHIELEQVRQMCVEDACNANFDRSVDMTCQYLTSVVSVCGLHGVKDSELNQHITEICPVTCPVDKVYSNCSSSCTSSCQSVGLFCATMCYPGCFCPEGTYENVDGTCVSQEACSCFYDGEWFESGSINKFINDTKVCTCNGGDMSCEIVDPGTLCPGDMEFFDCAYVEPGFTAAAGMMTCEQPFMVARMEECADGCSCPPGLYATPEMQCVPLEECGCVGANNKYFQSGESYQDDCNTCYCEGGLFVCTDNVCPKTCSSAGGAHYQTFDGLTYDFHGECEYVLATDFCPNNPGGGLFSIVTKNQKCGTTGMTCSKTVVITIKNKQITLKQGQEPTITTIANTRFRRAITGYTDHDASEIFLIKQKGLFIEISTCIGVTVLWDKGTRIYVRLTPTFATTVCGLCGNFDGIDTNDYTTSTGIMADPVEFGNSWKVPEASSSCKDATLSSQVNDSCTLRPERREWSEEKCSVILDASLFGECHTKVNPQRYFDACVLDTCGCDSGGDCECMCTAIAHYAHQCAQKGVVVEWRNMKRCPLMCEIYNNYEDECRWHYRACESCITDTCCPCQSSDDAGWCVEGCFPKCPEGFILDEMTQKCVAIGNSDAECTRYSVENKCRVCETCDVCKTKSGAQLRIQPGETKYFPLDTDTCEIEWCAATTDGDLCYNGTVNLYICEEEYKPIPEYDPYFYKLNCFNTTTSLCKNCRDCEKECIIREDSCDAERTIGDKWNQVFTYDPVPAIGPKTYCKNYECVAHPDATEPQCNLQREDLHGCDDSGKDKQCEWYEKLTEFQTGNPCCPVKYECVCVTCEYSDKTKSDSLKVGGADYWCKDDAESNCCYTDTCYNKTAIQFCPQIDRVQEACPTGPTPTCQTGYAWVNKTRDADCCPWGECECDACVDYDLQNNKRLMAVDATWNKKCLKFKCVRGVKAEGGCYKAINYANTTCSAAPDCPDRMHSVVYGRDQFDCCDLYRCECDKVCFVENNGTNNAYPPNTEWKMNGCWHHCTDPLDGAEGARFNQSECPYHRQICHKPEPCPTCHEIAGVEDDECGCPKYICKEIERCPLIECEFPFLREMIPSDPCLAPCYNCTCDHVCWDQFDDRTYVPEETWRRIYRKTERKCEDCKCTNDRDVKDKCLLESCTPVPCEEPAECPSPYDERITRITECGCTELIECRCPYCKFEDTVLNETEIGSTWTKGNVELGCYDTYNCLSVKAVGQDKECYNVTKKRNPCPEPIECPENYRRVKDEEKSCCYDDGECCDHFKCECVVCMFGGQAYQVGDTWTQDCLDYVCTDTVDEKDPNKCYLETYANVSCNDPKPTCEKCYKEAVLHARQVPEYCCPVYHCKPEKFCYDKNGEPIANGTEWVALDEDPNGCTKYRCYVSDADWESGVCPEPTKITPCIPDTTTCEKCENKTIGSDVCGCPEVNCSPLNKPTQCLEPAANQKVVSLATNDECFASKNCCVCDTSCMYNGVRRRLYETWWDESTCKRMRCVVPEVSVKMLNKENDDWEGIREELDYRQMMEQSGVARQIYKECQQDPSMCPEARDIGCPDPIPCKECQTTTPGKDKCGCDINICEDYVCPPSPFNRTSCPPPKSKLVEVSLKGLHAYFPCCPVGNVCECPDGCYDSNNVLRAVGEQWEEDVQDECGNKRRKTCQVSQEGDPDECPQVEEVPCVSPDPCPNCFDTVNRKDDYCCPQVDCVPVPDAKECVDPAANQKIVTLATQDECFPSKNCCICDTSCMYNGVRRKLYETWWDESTCKRMRCVVPEVSVEMLNKENDDWEGIREDLNYRDMMEQTGVAREIYKECQQDPSMCPEARDIGCPDPIPCKECQTTTPGKDKCGCDINICEDYVCPPYPFNRTSCPPPKSKLVETSLKGLHAYFPCCPVGNVCECPDGCYDSNNVLRAVGEQWEEDVQDECGNKRRKTCRVSREGDPDECPQVEEVPCISPDPCPNCFDTVNSKDDYCCPQVDCVPIPDPKECVDPAANQKVVSLATQDECFPSKNCCVCDTSCMYNGIRRKLYETWWDDSTCKRMRCIVPEVAVEMLNKENDDWEGIREDLDYRQMMEQTGVAREIYKECQQDPGMCPEARDIGCPDPIPCKECQTTTPGKDKCGCDINICEDYVCPPSPFNRTSCPPPKSKLVEVSLNGLHPYFPCCPVGNVCECPDGCYDSNNVLRAVGEQWEEDVQEECGSKRRKTCRVSREGDPDECPQVEEVPCVAPLACPNCHLTLTSKDEYCCDQSECVPVKCNVTSQDDCEEKYFPFTVMKTDAVKTKNECCPNYCDCPTNCVDEFDFTEHERNEQWDHPKSACWYRRCLVDKSAVIKQGCPYIVNETVCVEPKECDTCFHKVDTIDNCGCTQRVCEKDECPRPNCTDECKEIVDTGLKDSCGCPKLECKLKECAKTNLTCDDPEMDVYKFMDHTINVCCPQYGCRCNFSRCEDAHCAAGEVAVRNLTDQRCCCPKYDCVDKPPPGDYCMLGTEKKKIGEKWINKDNPCEMMQCTYLNPHSKKTKIDIFPRYTCDQGATRNRRAICANNEPSYTATTKNGCCRESVCPCSCELFGDPHFITFDGLNYDFQGKCTYTLMKEYKFNETEILVDNELCRWWSARDKDLSCMKSLVVLHKGDNYTFTAGQKFFFNNKQILLRDAWQRDGSDVRVETFSFLTLELHILSLGIDIVYESFAAYQSLVLRIPYETYEGQMEGLCGTCNNNQDDDMTGRSRNRYDARIVSDVDKFGDSWLKDVKDFDHSKCYPVEPECPAEPVYPDCPDQLPVDKCINCENRCHLAHSKCQSCEADPCMSLQESSAFDSCRSQVDPESYIPQCHFDLALLTNSTEQKCDPCNSPSIAQYATKCELVRKCALWRSTLGCPAPECPSNQEFRECEVSTLKYKSCDNLTVYDDGMRVEGCFCPEGQVRKSAGSTECVPTQCCFSCRSAPACESGAEASVQGEDECGCPVYYCQVPGETSNNCEPVSTELTGAAQKNDAGVDCISMSTITTQLCGGKCSSSFSLNSQAEATETCNSCKPTSTELKTLSLMCLDGSKMDVQYENHIECSCGISPCE